MKNIKKFRGILCFGLITMWLGSSVGTAAGAEAPELTEIWLNSTKISVQQYGEERAGQLEQAIQNLVPSDAVVELDEEDPDHLTVMLSYSDGEKKGCCFHLADDIWYARDETGAVYENADFITDYIEVLTAEEAGGGDALVELLPPDPELIQTLLADGGLDERYWFVSNMAAYTAAGWTEEGAKAFVRDQLLSDQKLYQYAVSNGYEITQEELETRRDERLRAIGKAENYDEVCGLLEEIGLSYEQYLKECEALDRVSETVADLYRMKYEEYRHGSDSVNGVQCDSVTDYWNLFVTDVVESELEGQDLQEYEQKLDAAAAFYEEWKTR